MSDIQTVDRSGAGAERRGRTPADFYRALRVCLEGFSNENIVVFSFSALENILKRPLPRSARIRESWWTNEPKGRGHALSWLEVGWHVAQVDLKKERVTFSRGI
ncbi:MAG: DUF7662 domain-containing protein [Actinomycetota bacterium]